VFEFPPLPDIFGNYAIKGISEVLAPEAISWLPSAPGWRWLGLVLLLLAGWRAWLALQKWRRNRYRRKALQQLDKLADNAGHGLLQALSALLKGTALQAYPRIEVASLSGDEWLLWLNHNSGGACFSPTSAKLLTEAVYRAPAQGQTTEYRQLILEARNWIESHREASRD
jgi:hypothetical protein